MSKKFLSVVVLLPLVCLSTLYFFAQNSEKDMGIEPQAVQDLLVDVESTEEVDKGNSSGVVQHDDFSEVVMELPSKPEKINLSVTFFLDDSDKTARNMIILENYSNISHASKLYDYEERVNAISPSTIELLIKSLVHDAHVRNETTAQALQSKHLDEVDLTLEGVVPTLLEPVDYLSEEYLLELNSLVRQYNLLHQSAENTSAGIETKAIDSDGDGVPDINFKLLGSRVAQKIEDRKEVASIFFYGLMEKYLLGDSYSVEDKIKFTRHLIALRDKSLILGPRKYFNSLEMIGDISKSEKQMIHQLIIDFEGVIKK